MTKQPWRTTTAVNMFSGKMEKSVINLISRIDSSSIGRNLPILSSVVNELVKKSMFTCRPVGR